MSLRTIQRLAMASVLALGGITAVGCDDDNGDEDGDDGAPDGGDGGGDGDGVPDGTPDGADGADGDGGDGPVLCGVNEDVECAPTDTGWNDFVLDACCDTDDAKSCGAVVPELEGSPLIGCFAKAQPGNGSESCSDLFDQLDGVDDNGFTTTLSGAQVTFPGCCTPSGLCGVNVDSFSLGAGADLQVGFGCIPISKFDLAGDDADAGVPDGGAPEGDAGAPEDPILPYCVPEKATADMACPPNMGIFGGPDICEELTAAGLPIVAPCTRETQTPVWVCALQGWQTIATGEVPDSVDDYGDCLELLPEFVNGCGVGEARAGCIPNVPAEKFGCEMVTAGPIPGLPEYACGCGDGVVAAGCIPNVPTDICGATAVTTGPIPNVPEYACGCGDGVRGDGRCIPNIPNDLCGAVDITTGPIAGLPEYACGCGNGIRGNGACIPNVDTAICGAVDHTTGDVPGVPEYACGCGDGVRGNGQCIPNVPNTTCGAIEVTAGPIPNLPNAACGCGDEMLGAGCIPNVPNTICGAVASCTPVGMQGNCAADQVCVSNTPTADPDNIGDACEAP